MAGALTLQSAHELLCSSHMMSGSCWDSWSSLPLTYLVILLCLKACRHFQHSPLQTYKIWTAWEFLIIFFSKTVIPSFRYSRGITLCMGQVFHQNIQTFVLLIEELLGPSKVHVKLKRKNSSVNQQTVGILITALLDEFMWSTCRHFKQLSLKQGLQA